MLLTSRQLVNLALGKLADFQPFEPVHGPSPALGRINATHLQTELDVSNHIEKREECQRLPDQRRVPFGDADLIESLPIEADLTLTWLFQACEHPQGRGFATARRSHDGQELPFIYGKVNRIDGGNIVKSFADLIEYHHRIFACRRHLPVPQIPVRERRDDFLM